jgi:hypothetical protein
VQGTHAHFSWLAAVSCLHLFPPTILHSIIHYQNSPHNLKNTLCYKCRGKLGSFSSKYTLDISKYQVPLLALDIYLAATGEIQLKEYSFYVKMEGPCLKVKHYPSLSIRILHGGFYATCNALLDLVSSIIILLRMRTLSTNSESQFTCGLWTV